MTDAEIIEKLNRERCELAREVGSLRAKLRRYERAGKRSNKLREMREQRLLTQEQLAQRAKVAVRTVQSVEWGRKCQPPTKRALLHALGIPMERAHEVFPAPPPIDHAAIFAHVERAS